jgi:hypothetical protein
VHSLAQGAVQTLAQRATQPGETRRGTGAALWLRMHALLIATLLSADPQFSAPPMVDASGEVQQETTPVWHLWPIAIGGAAVGLATYAGGLVSWFSTIRCGEWLSNCQSTSSWLWIPVVGSYLALLDPATSRSQNMGPTIALALAQTAAIAMCIVGPLISVGGTKITATPAGIAGTF